ncbi:DUF4331 domain-containing protein [Salinisphaera sp. P385]|uniref:DUF4331 domain-containing protein n=1 Tax=Spectribacter acetivorans TaxID=3075603 RepID=A0ABU3B6G7_9GAMM|nr:DUF4331 domain-containing protein [Salinisphaera sp. P385]MDT0618041.1 DUF4331 domain-containing protein [Salinisphaera sp. P385]
MLNRTHPIIGTAATLAVTLAAGSAAFASSHREAPFITEKPKVDGTDFYMFRSYESGREDFVTLIANYQPLQDAYGGPNYFTMDEDARYEIHVDNDGDTVEDLTFRFEFDNEYRNASLPVGPDNSPVTIPLANVGPGGNASPVGPGVDDNAGLNVIENYTVTLIEGDRKQGMASPVTQMSTGDTTFRKPVDNIGTKTIPDYSAYANNHIYTVNVPGCDTPAQLFVGQRQEGFVVNLGQVFDRVNLPAPPVGNRDRGGNILGDKNITSLALEIDRNCLTAGNEPVIGAWTTASLPQAEVQRPNPTVDTPAVSGGAFTQVSRLGSPLVNEVVIGLDQKDAFNNSEPKDDLTNFANFVLYPTLPVLINALFEVPPPATPRFDLVAAFVTGIRTNVGGNMTNFTQPQAITDANADEITMGGEMLRLNTAFPTDPTPVGMQEDLGFLACDLAGFPNGRRPVDDVVDIALTVAEGAITAENPNNLQTCDVSGGVPGTTLNGGNVVNDGAQPNPGSYLTQFPYLDTPIPGATTP